MRASIVFGLALMALLVGTLACVLITQLVESGPATIVVPDDYSTIQEAINAASTGDMIFVNSGIYYENLVVNKSISLVGENEYTTVIDGNQSGNVVYVTADAVNITALTIRNSGIDQKAGILVGRQWNLQSLNNNISGNLIMNNYYGILLACSFNSTISDNNVTLNTIGIQDQSQDYQCGIWTINADGTNQTLLTTHNMWDDGPEWCPNNSKILFERVSKPFIENPNWNIWVMNTDGTNQKQLTTDSKVNMLGGWSPDSSRIVYSSTGTGNQDIWTMNSDGTNNKQLTTDPSMDSMPTYSPDGSKIAFVSNRTGNQDMWIMNADGTNQTQLTSEIPWVMGGSWSPDGTRIVFHSVESEQNGNWDMWMINSDGTNQTKLLPTSSREAFPHWSPDGNKIAYGSDEAGSWDIWVMNADGTNRQRLTTEGNAEEICSWNADGTKLVFARAQFGSLTCFNKIIQNIVYDNEGEGIRLQQVIGVTVDKNWISHNGRGGLTVFQAGGNTISGNTLFNNTGSGIYFNMVKPGNVLRNNNMTENMYNFCIDAHWIGEYLNDMDGSNTVNGKPVYYWINQADRQVPLDAGCVLLVNCANILVEDLNLSNHCGFGVLFWSTTNSTVRNVTSSYNVNGIGLSLSSGNNVVNNTVSNILPQVGIWLQDSANNILRDNIMVENSISFGVVWNGPNISIQSWMNDIDTSNTIDGKPVYYWVGKDNLTIPEDASVAYLVNCTGMTARNLDISRNYLGVVLVNTNNSIVDNVKVEDCTSGIVLVFSHDNKIRNSVATDGIWFGNGGLLIGCNNNTVVNNTFSNMPSFIQQGGTANDAPNGIGLLVIGNGNTVLHNNFINNTVQAMTQPGFNNTWNSSCEGNYWSNYNGSDQDDDGVGDDHIPWEGLDSCPLMNVYWSACDINHDLKVDMRDIGKSAKAFSAIPEDSYWNPHVDITGPEPLFPDSKVDMRDISLIARHFGEHI